MGNRYRYFGRCHTAPVGDEHESSLNETLMRRQEAFRGAHLLLRVDTVEDADGERHTREVVVHPGAVAVIPLLDDGRLLLVRQYRHPAEQVLLELPAGTLDTLADGTKEEPAATAARELAEETGHRARHWRPVARFFTAPGFATEEMHLFLATGLEPIAGHGGPPADERLELAIIDWRAAVSMALKGEIRDAKSLAGLYWLALLAERGELPELGAG
jgi:ADP-ribose pyrophosphatase